MSVLAKQISCPLALSSLAVGRRSRPLILRCLVRAFAAGGLLLQGASGAHAQIPLRRNPLQWIGVADYAIGAHGKGKLVAIVDESERCLQQMIAIVSATEHMQKQVEFCRRWKYACNRGHSGNSQRSIIRRSLSRS